MASSAMATVSTTMESVAAADVVRRSLRVEYEIWMVFRGSTFDLAFELERLFDFDFDRQTVRIPSPSAVDPEPLHRLVPADSGL